MNNSETIVNKITEQIELLNEQNLDTFSGDTLSKIAVRLASYKAGLGKYSTEAKKDVWVAEKNLKIAKAKSYKELRADSYGSGEANELKTIEVEKEMNELIECQELEDRITTLSYNVHDLIDAIKSRIINVQMELRESQVR